MAPPRSAGILLYRRGEHGVEVLLTHPGGPYWRNKDTGAWMIPKGMVEAGESPLQAAVREFAEELGAPTPSNPAFLCSVRQSGGKIVSVFVSEGDFDSSALKSVEFEMEWPPRSGEMQRFPEVDAARWFPLAGAGEAILPSQRPILEALGRWLGNADT